MLATLNPLYPKPAEESVVVVDRPTYCIGRALDCQLRLEHPTVGRHHCELILQGESIFVRDLESLNGTYINSQRVLEITELNEGDLLEISMYLFRMEISYRSTRADYLGTENHRSDSHWNVSPTLT
jgi:pSer/pThr/pTyr-binding forkhead associated (FHA) protein